jgi:hypothetical protein
MVIVTVGGIGGAAWEGDREVKAISQRRHLRIELASRSALDGICGDAW